MAQASVIEGGICQIYGNRHGGKAEHKSGKNEQRKNFSGEHDKKNLSGLHTMI